MCDEEIILFLTVVIWPGTYADPSLTKCVNTCKAMVHGTEVYDFGALEPQVVHLGSHLPDTFNFKGSDRSHDAPFRPLWAAPLYVIAGDLDYYFSVCETMEGSSPKVGGPSHTTHHRPTRT